MEEQHYQLLDGKAVSAQMKKEMAEEVAQIKAAGGKIPHLAAILVGHDGGSETYVASKVKTCQEIGFKSTLIRFEEDVTEEELLRKVDELNNDPDVDGFIVQLPLPKHISEQKVIETIDYRKDVDGFHPYNVGRLCQRAPRLRPCTPRGRAGRKAGGHVHCGLYPHLGLRLRACYLHLRDGAQPDAAHVSLHRLLPHGLPHRGHYRCPGGVLHRAEKGRAQEAGLV